MKRLGSSLHRHVAWVKMGNAGLSHSTFFYNFQKGVELAKDDLLGGLLQDLTTEVSVSLEIVKYAGDIG